MIAFPKNWRELKFTIPIDSDKDFCSSTFINYLGSLLIDLNVRKLAYSGGIDSTIILVLLSYLFDKVETFVVSCRGNHPDVLFSEIGSKAYGSTHNILILNSRTDLYGDNAVKEFFSNFNPKEIICGDGIDELAAGYYGHLNCDDKSYFHYLNRLVPDHLIPLDENSGNTQVSLPYLDPEIVKYLLSLSLNKKVADGERKIPIYSVARQLKIPQQIIDRNKYGFCDAFLEKDK